ncbi:MAG: YajQ family cyclic di-GMP-binding protein [Gammaproteobacteria bacterium]
MPSFDIVSEVDQHEMQNVVDQLKRELDNRFDFKGVDFEVLYQTDVIDLSAPEAFQVNQMLDILRDKAVRRNIDTKSFDPQELDKNLAKAKLPVRIRQGISKEDAKDIVKRIKASKAKVQASIQGDQVRVTGKKRDDLQAVMALLREADLSMPIQFDNFRD